MLEAGKAREKSSRLNKRPYSDGQAIAIDRVARSDCKELYYEKHASMSRLDHDRDPLISSLTAKRDLVDYTWDKPCHPQLISSLDDSIYSLFLAEVKDPAIWTKRLISQYDFHDRFEGGFVAATGLVDAGF
ncbi:hypothetical protein KSP39_PZI019195 [Platanthera zijinensis]|uniref:Uncharacterized protein n=1 Tax=Platanthera zijinensis TaxID=2320716 RepID=A0AAP0B1U0_9ASPA